eukprot:2928071-Pyramimonas_sp.AAC.1
MASLDAPPCLTWYVQSCSAASPTRSAAFSNASLYWLIDRRNSFSLGSRPFANCTRWDEMCASRSSTETVSSKLPVLRGCPLSSGRMTRQRRW